MIASTLYIEAAKCGDHLIRAFLRTSGLGKTTLTNIIANELGVDIKITYQGRRLVYPYNLNENDVLFIDEIHRLNRSVEESVFHAMEDFALDIIIGKDLQLNLFE